MLLLGIALMAAAALIPGAGELILVLAAFHALRGPRQSVEALLVLAMTIMVNKSLIPVDISLLRWMVLIAAFGRTVWDTFVGAKPVPRPFWVMVGLLLTLSLFAGVASWLPTVSLFKTFSFFMGAATGLVALYRTRHLSLYWQSLLLTVAVLFIIGSVPLYFTDYGFARNGVSFQGLLTHPQTYGPVIAVFTAYVTAIVLFYRYRPWWLWAAVAAGWIGVYFSQSRTGMFALLLAGALTVGFGWFKARTWRPLIMRALNGPVLAVLILGVIGVGLVYGPQLQDGIVSFLIKDEMAETVTGSLQESRSSLIDQSMANFRASPLTGIGLGVPSDLARSQIGYGPFGLPISASVEKGFAPAAVLEETGLLGSALIIAVLLALLVPVVRRGSLAMCWMALTALLMNLGEAVLFAIGGNGLFVWLMFALAYTTAVAPRRAPAPRSAYARPPGPPRPHPQPRRRRPARQVS